MTDDRLYTIETGTSARAIARLMTVLFPDARTVLDTTFGSGAFWKGTGLPVTVTGMDINPERARDVCADFTRLPFADDSFDVVVFDPPYHTDVGHAKASETHKRYGSFATIDELRPAVERGTAEAWRVARLGAIVKVQDYIHASRAVWMSLWVHGAIPVEPYDVLHVQRACGKIRSPRWTRQLSVWRNHATYWVYRKGGPVHRARRPAASAYTPLLSEVAS